MDLGLLAWKNILAQKEIMPHDHVSSRFTIGSKKTLDFDGIGKKITDFYENNYSLDKIKIVSMCNKAFNNELDQLRTYLESNQKSINNHSPPQIHYKAPELDTHKLLFVKAQGAQAIQVSSFLDDVLGSMRATNEYFQFFQVVFQQLLNQKLGELGACSVSNTFENSYFKLYVMIQPSFEGKKNLLKIIQIYNEVLDNTGPSLNIANLKDIKRTQFLVFSFEKAEEELHKLTDSLANNFANYGLDRMFMADKIITSSFQPVQIHEVYTSLRKSKQVWSIIADFPVEETLSDSPDLLKQHPVEELMKMKLMTSTFLGEEQVDSENRLPLKLNFKHADHGFFFGYANFSIPPHDLKLGSYIFEKNPLVVSAEILKKISEKPEGKLKVLIEEAQTYVVRNTLRSTPQVVISIQFTLEKFSQVLDMDLQILKHVINYRLGGVASVLEKIGGNISAAHNSTTASLELTISSLTDELDQIFKAIEDKILGSPTIKENELKLALNTIYQETQKQQLIFLEGFSVFGTWVSQNRNYTKLETVQYLKDSVTRKLSFDMLQWTGQKGWKITKTLVEGHVDSGIFEKIKANLLMKIDPSYSEKRVILTNGTDFKLLRFNPNNISGGKIDSAKTRVIDFKRIDRTNPNDLYTTFYYVGEANDTEKLAHTQILLNILHNQAFDQLRTKLKLGYVTGAKMLITHGSIYFAVIVQTLDMDRARKEVEKFYSHMEEYLSNMNPEKFEQRKNGAVSSLRQQKNNFASEVQEKWSYWVLGLPMDLKEKVIESIKSKCSLNDVKNLYLTVVKQATANKVIVDSKYSPEAYKNLKREGLYRGKEEEFEKVAELAF